MNFDPSKDYYGVLGVTASAELAVIKAAYKALAGIYHPDRNSSDEAAEKMRAVNEAWDVLSEPTTRKAYDEFIREKKPESEAFDDTDLDEDINEYFENDWNFALSYYPDLAEHAKRLGTISRRLEIAYKALIIEDKNFKDRKTTADNMEQLFLKTYFSSNDEILAIARKLIFVYDNKKLLRELNVAVSILGTSDPAPIINRFNDELIQLWRENRTTTKPAGVEINDEGALSGYGIFLSCFIFFFVLVVFVITNY